MASPEEELAAVLQQTGCGRNEVVSFSAIAKMFQCQVNPAQPQPMSSPDHS